MLRDGMARFVADVPAPAGLASSVSRRYRRRRLAVRAAVACGTAAVAAAAVIAANGAASGAPVTGTSAPAYTTGYVIKHADKALSSASLRDLVEETYSPRQVVGATVLPRLVTWYYRDRARAVEFGGNGRPVVAEALPSGVTVDYVTRTWITVRTAGGLGPTAKYDCRPGLGGGFAAAPAFIRAMLACGGLADAGPARVDGVAAIKLVSTRRAIEIFPLTVYVNPDSYLPVRLVESGSVRSVQDFRWLPATAAHVALLNVRIPAGFRQVRSLHFPIPIPLPAPSPAASGGQ
jgi:hypothetical protein